MKKVLDAVEKYLSELARVIATRKKSGSLELRTRPFADILFRALVAEASDKKDKAEVISEERYIGNIQPDWRIQSAESFGVFFFADHKPPDFTGAYEIDENDFQIKKYLLTGRPLFIFDGIEFILIKENKEKGLITTRYFLTKKPVKDKNLRVECGEVARLFEEVRGLLAKPGFRKYSDDELTSYLGLQARELRHIIHKKAVSPPGSGVNSDDNFLICKVKELKKELVKDYDSSFNRDLKCADFIAQVLCFGLLFAHKKVEKLEKDPVQRKKQIEEYWESLDCLSILRPFVGIYNVLHPVLNSKNQISVTFNYLKRFFAHAEFEGSNEGEANVHKLYEEFFKKYSPQERFDYGLFFTPQIVAAWISAFTNEISKNCFGHPFYDRTEKIIDPCVGTGAILENVLLSIPKNMLRKPTIIGYELLPAPFTLCNFRLLPFAHQKKIRIKLFLTDTLSDTNFGKRIAGRSLFSKELREAQLYAKPPIRIVLGNPPSAPFTGDESNRLKINQIFNIFRPPKSLRHLRQNTQKALQNEAYKFLCWGLYHLHQAKRGILCFLMPGAFVEKESFSFARKVLIEKSKEIYVLILDEDLRSGNASESIFNTLQARCIITVVYEKDNKGPAKLFVKDISKDRRSRKEEYFRQKIVLSEFKEKSVLDKSFRFSETKSYPEKIWAIFIPLLQSNHEDGLFLSKCSAVKCAPSSLLFHTDLAILKRRSMEISQIYEHGVSKQDTIQRWFEGQKKKPSEAKITPEVCKAIAESIRNDKTFVPYIFRPFLQGWILNSSKVFEVLQNLPNSGTRVRPEIRSIFQKGAVGIAIAPAPKDISEKLTRIASFLWNLPDNDIAARGNGMVYSGLRLVKDPTGQHVHSNLSPLAEKAFSWSKDKIKDIVFYIYAILSSDAFLSFFEGAIFRSSSADNPLRIPVPNSQKFLEDISNLGRSLALLEKEDIKYDEPANADVNSILLEDGFDLHSFEIDEKIKTIKLISKTNQNILLPYPETTGLKFLISGHNVLEKWLRERKKEYLQRALTPNDIAKLNGLIKRLNEQQKTIYEINLKVEKILNFYLNL